MTSATAFKHFQETMTRKQKIDTLEKMRKELEPKASASASTRYQPNQQRGPTTDSKPISAKERHRIMMQILSSARIVCTTLSMSASEMFNNFSLGDFEYLIVDEAC